MVHDIFIYHLFENLDEIIMLKIPCLCLVDYDLKDSRKERNSKLWNSGSTLGPDAI